MNPNEFMKIAVDLGKSNTKGGPNGAVIVKDGEIIATAVSERFERKDPTAHAELLAIQIAAKKLDTANLEGCEVYASGEPCPMCLAAIYHANIKVVYFHEPTGSRHIYEELAKKHEDRSIVMKRLIP